MREAEGGTRMGEWSWAHDTMSSKHYSVVGVQKASVTLGIRFGPRGGDKFCAARPGGVANCAVFGDVELAPRMCRSQGENRAARALPRNLNAYPCRAPPW